MIGGIGMKFLKTYLLGFIIVFAILTIGRTITKISEYKELVDGTATKLNGAK